jgi:hypothetical protein
MVNCRYGFRRLAIIREVFDWVLRATDRDDDLLAGRALPHRNSTQAETPAEQDRVLVDAYFRLHDFRDCSSPQQNPSPE